MPQLTDMSYVRSEFLYVPCTCSPGRCAVILSYVVRAIPTRLGQKRLGVRCFLWSSVFFKAMLYEQFKHDVDKNDLGSGISYGLPYHTSNSNTIWTKTTWGLLLPGISEVLCNINEHFVLFCLFSSLKNGEYTTGYSQRQLVKMYLVRLFFWLTLATHSLSLPPDTQGERQGQQNIVRMTSGDLFRRGKA